MAPLSGRAPALLTDLSAVDLDLLLGEAVRGVILIDREGRIVYANARAAEAAGMPRATLIGRTLRHLYPDLADGEAALRLSTSLARQEPAVLDLRAPVNGRRRSLVLTPLGGHFLVSMEEPPGVDGQEASIGADVSEQRNAERAVREREEELRLITDAVPVLISRVDAEQQFRFVNGAYEEWFGVSRAEILGRHLADILGEAAYAVVRPHVEAALSGRVVRYEAQIPFEGVGTRWVRAQYVPHVEEGTVVGFYVVVLDVTDRKESEEKLASAYEALEREHKRLRVVLDVMPAAVFIADPEGRLVETNRAARRIWGGDTPLVPRSSFDQYKGWFVDSGRRLTGDDWGMALALKGEEVLDGQEVEIETFDGRRKTILNYALPIRTGERLEGAVAVSVDVSRLRAAEAALRELNATLERRVAERTAELEERNRELQSFAYVASHDLREPLRKIQAFGGLLQEEVEGLGEEGRFYVERMRSAAVRMDGLLSDLLAYSRVLTHTQPFEPVRLERVVSEVLEDYALRIHETEAKVDVQADVGLEGDAAQLRQLLGHLVDNALKFRRAGVAPRLCIRAAVEARPGGPPACRITVEDNGIGIEQRYLERIFEPFERLHGRDEYEGTGIGLAVCRRIVSRHGGTVRAESAPGEGSRFVVTLPLAAAPTRAGGS